MDSQADNRRLPLFGLAVATVAQFALLVSLALDSDVADAILLITAVGTAISAFRLGIEFERIRVRERIEV